MVTMMQQAQRRWPLRFRKQANPSSQADGAAVSAVEATSIDWPIAPDDPLLGYFHQTSGVIEVDRLNLDSPALRRLKEEGAVLIVPLMSQGELVGLVNLGKRRSDQDYSSDDRRFLNDLAAQAAPAVRVAQLVRQQELAAVERERLENELRVARTIQQTLLPREVPQLDGWEVAAYWQPARAVSGDFYDFLTFADGRIGLIIADVTDKGVPAALVMATTRALLRAAAEQLVAPGLVLQRANEVLCPDIPPKMFVTCLYALLDPATGHIRYANAGHDLPYRRTAQGVEELHARGMPLGLLPGMLYEEKELVLEPGETILFHSDGLVEAHSPQREMFGFPRLRDLVCRHAGGAELIPFLLEELAAFTGPAWEQEDDVTLMTLRRQAVPAMDRRFGWQTMAEFELPSAPGNERVAMERVAEIVQPLGLPQARLERLKTAVAEASMNAMEHGNQYCADQPTAIQVRRSENRLVVRIIDSGRTQEIPEEPQVPDLDAKLAGLQSPRGWGLFLIQSMVDQIEIINEDQRHVVELYLALPPDGPEGGNNDTASA
jgi:serine phosphatase RsbU (regulator of sigma subunit)/anti-sigma regulatory factor (Ser/Thr protein kinase)